MFPRTCTFVANKCKGMPIAAELQLFYRSFWGKIACARTRREYSEQLSHWNIEGRRKFGCKSQRGALDGARLGVARLGRRERRIVLHRNAPHPHPHCNRAASVVARARYAYIRNHANVMRMRCSCGPWRLVPCRWRLLQPRPVRAHPASILDRHRPP